MEIAREDSEVLLYVPYESNEEFYPMLELKPGYITHLGEIAIIASSPFLDGMGR